MPTKFIRLKKVISGGQIGADEAALFTSKKFKFETGGWMPKRFLALDGLKPQFKKLYGIQEHPQGNYTARTFQNVEDSDGTIRCGYNFSTPGEVITLEAVRKFSKPHLDIALSLSKTKLKTQVEEALKFLRLNQIKILNVAGNSEWTCPGTYEATCKFLTALFTSIRQFQK